MDSMKILTIVGSILIVTGIILLFMKSRSNESTLKTPGDFTITGPPGIVLIIFGVVCLILPVHWATTGHGHDADEPTPPGGTASPNTSGTASATLVFPTEGAGVSRSKGFTAKGTATSLGSSTIWILDHDSGGYTVDQKAVVSAGQWTAVDKPLGDTSDRLPFDLGIVVVLASPGCAAELESIGATDEDYTEQLPGGCQVFAQRTVTVSRP